MLYWILNLDPNLSWLLIWTALAFSCCHPYHPFIVFFHLPSSSLSANRSPELMLSVVLPDLEIKHILSYLILSYPNAYFLGCTAGVVLSCSARSRGMMYARPGNYELQQYQWWTFRSQLFSLANAIGRLHKRGTAWHRKLLNIEVFYFDKRIQPWTVWVTFL